MLKLQSVVREFLNQSINPLNKIQNLKCSLPYALCAMRFALVALLFVLWGLPLPAARAAQVELSWDPPSGPVTGYKAHYGSDSKNYENSVDVGNYTSCTISGLQEGETYYFAVTARNDTGESDFSEELVYTVPVNNSSPPDSGPGSSENLSMEFGEVQVDHNWQYVEFSKSFSDPIVVANPISLKGSDPAVIRIRDVDSDGFEMRVQEWNYLDGIHALETVSYVVMERGSFTLENGARVEAGRFNTDKVGTFGQVSFTQGFPNAPVVVTSITSFNGADAVTGRLRNVNTRGFGYAMQEQESLSDGHANESIAYIAWEPSAGTVEGITYEIGKTGNDISHSPRTIMFKNDLKKTPAFFADMQTANGTDTANIRWQTKNRNSATVKIDEEQSVDTEMDHAAETVGYMAMVKASFPTTIEFGEVQIDHNWKRVSFSKSFSDPIVVGNSLSLNGAHPAVVRIRNVSKTGFELRVQEWDYLDGSHALETVSFVALERGSFTLENGARIEAGRFSSDSVNSFQQIGFNQSFTTVPVVVTSITSFNGTDTVTGRLRNINTQGFEYTMQEQESLSDGHAGESIAYIAWEPSAGAAEGLTYEISKTSRDVGDSFYTIQFTTDFKSSPVFLANMQTANGMDTANVRWQNKDAYAIEVRIDEEQSQDDEIQHTSEVVGCMAFSQ